MEENICIGIKETVIFSQNTKCVTRYEELFFLW